MRSPAILVLCSFSLLVHAQVELPAVTRADLMEIKALAGRLRDPSTLTAATQGRFPTAFVHGQCTVGFLGRVGAGFDAETATSEQVHIGARVGDVLSFRVDAYHLDALNGIPGLSYAELAACAQPSLDRLVKATRADSVQRGINLPQTYTGRDVLIGVLDWGFDYTHPMFYDTAMMVSRVRAAWDMWRQAGPAPPAFGYGAEFTLPGMLAAAQADTANVYSYATHGSHVAGIAGGGGAGTQYRGIAFDSQFLFCTFLVDAAAALDGFAWMKSVADLDQKRLVVNCSWGLYYMGTLDGHSLISQAIDQLSSEGVVFCNSGGNNGDVNFHIKKTFSNDTLRSIVQFYPYSANENMWGQSITMWGEEDQSFSAGFKITSTSNAVLSESPWYHTATQAAYLDSFMVQGQDTVFFNLSCDAAHPLNGRPHFRLRVKNTSPSLRIQLKAGAASGVVHFWNVTELSNGVGNWGQAFQGGGGGLVAGDHHYGISEPACAESTITVAAYSAEYYLGSEQIPFGGAIAGFSSFGPTMDERMKPDLTAPGVSVVSSISSFTDNNYTPVMIVPFQGRDYPFAAFSGTSMSSPAVSGIVALILEADPDITPAEVRALLKGTARTDNQTGTIPLGGSTRWGMGKVNAYHAVCEQLGVVSVPEGPSLDDEALLWPNPVGEVLHIMTSSTGALTISVMDMSGRVVHTDRYLGNRALLGLGALCSGIYMVRVEQEGRIFVRPVVKE